MTAPVASIVETAGFPKPPVNARDFVRRATVVPWMMDAAPPPAIMAKVHFKKGDNSTTKEAVTMVPATMAAGDAIRSNKWSSQGI